MNFKRGFTLAEVLITLSIIGVVAALTIPSLVVKNQEKERIVQLKKVYNTFSNAHSHATLEYGDPSGWGWIAPGDLQSSKNGMDKIAPYLTIAKRCDGVQGCFPANTTYKFIDGTNDSIYDNKTNVSMAVLLDGTAFFLYSSKPECSEKFGESDKLRGCAIISVDVNGAKGPNKVGNDFFFFWMTPFGVIPEGTTDDTTYKLENCKQKGRGCTAWAIYKENINYPKNWNEIQ